MYYYAISDIHGYLSSLKETLKLVDLKSNPENKLIFLGDYIDLGDNSCECLYYIKKLSEKYKEQVIVLRGNHEEMFLEWLSKPIENITWFNQERNLEPVKSFLTKEQFNEILNLQSPDIFCLSKLISAMVKDNHKELITWIKKMSYYFQTENQIFVHAGIDEEAEDLWMHGTPKEYFTSKYPAEIGHFYKDIIAGHIGTAGIREDKNCHEVYWDGKSHYYIDGTVQVSGCIPVLKYDTQTKIYTSFRKTKDGKFEEYEMKRRD